MTLDDLKGYQVVGQAGVTHPDVAPVKKDALGTATKIATTLFPGSQKIGESLESAGENVKNLVTGGRAKYEANLPENTVNVPQLAGAYTAAGASVLGTAGVGTGGGILAQALKSAGIGAALAGGSGVAKGDTGWNVVKDAATGAAVGGITSGALNASGSALKGAVRAMPQRLIRSATGQSKAELLAGKDISQYVLDNKKIGTAHQLITGSQAAIDSADGFINTALKSPEAASKTVPVKDILSDITQSINDSGGEIDEEGVRSIISGLAPQIKRKLSSDELSLADANALRKQLDTTLGNRAFISAQLPYNKGILMDFTNALREQVKGKAPEGTRAAFNTLQKEIKLRDLLIAKSAQGSRNQIIGLGDLISGGIGGTLGGIPGIAVGAAAKRAAESTFTKTGGAVLLHHLDRHLSPVLSSLEPAAQTAIVNGIIQAIQQNEDNK